MREEETAETVTRCHGLPPSHRCDNLMVFPMVFIVLVVSKFLTKGLLPLNSNTSII